MLQQQAEEVYWLLFIFSLHLCIRAKAWRVELIWVGNPNDVVEVASEQKDSNTTITWLQTFQIFKSRSLPFLPSSDFNSADANVNQPYQHPAKLVSVVHYADRNASKFGDSAYVLPCSMRDGNACVNKQWGG